MIQPLEVETKTPSELLPLFYQKHNLGMDGGQSSSTVKMDITKGIHFYIPNFNARRNAVLRHDIHHLVTGYSAAYFLGECEISAWEIASGCRKYWAAFLINTSGVLLGCLINPKKICQAYARGSRTKNLYHDEFTEEELMHLPVDKIKSFLMLDQYPKNSKPGFSELISLGMFLIFASIYSIIMIATLPILLMYNIWIWCVGRFDGSDWL
ncbi:MAG: hypothetical protein ABIQ11_01805 [Saprospiraceae bacterium]